MSLIFHHLAEAANQIARTFETIPAANARRFLYEAVPMIRTASPEAANLLYKASGSFHSRMAYSSEHRARLQLLWEATRDLATAYKTAINLGDTASKVLDRACNLSEEWRERQQKTKARTAALALGRVYQWSR